MFLRLSDAKWEFFVNKPIKYCGAKLLTGLNVMVMSSCLIRLSVVSQPKL